MSLVSQQQLLQNQLQLKQLDEQRLRQAEQTKSFQSTQTQEMLNSLRQKEVEKSAPLKKDPSDPSTIQMPTNANPTELLASRFNTWRNIIGCLIHYLKEIVAVHEEISRQQIRLHHAITFPFLTQGLDGDFYQPIRLNNNGSGSATPGNGLFSNHNSSNNTANNNVANDLARQNDEFEMARKFFLPLGSGSIQDLPTVLYQYHSNAALLAQATVKELNTSIIPRLEDLKRDLLVKIKEIKTLQSDFKNQISSLQTQTKSGLSSYSQSIEIAKRSPNRLDPKQDPYILKLILDRQIKKQLTEENYLHEAFINLQTSGKELEKVVYIEVQTALTVYAKLLGQQAQNVFDGLISKLDSGILTKDPAFEWDSFIAKDSSNFIDLNLPMRHSSDIVYKNQNDPLAFEIRSGYLERKSKYLKSYTKSWYVLTSSFIHEFKSADRKRDPYPTMSLPLEDCSISEHSRKDERNPDVSHKFVLHTKSSSGGLMSKGHNWVFKAQGYDSMMLWYNDLKRLTSLPTPQARSTLAWERRKSRRLASLASNGASRPASMISSRISRNPSYSAGNHTRNFSGSVTGTGGYNGIAPNIVTSSDTVTPLQKQTNRFSRMSLRDSPPQRNTSTVRQSLDHDSLSTVETDTMLSMPKHNHSAIVLSNDSSTNVATGSTDAMKLPDGSIMQDHHITEVGRRSFELASDNGGTSRKVTQRTIGL